MWEGGLALTQLAAHSVKLSIKVVVKAGEKKKKTIGNPSANAVWAAYSGISQKLKVSNEASAIPPSPAQLDQQATCPCTLRPN